MTSQHQQLEYWFDMLDYDATMGVYSKRLYGRSPQPRVLHLEKYDTWWLNFFCKNLGVRSKTWFRRGSRKLNPSNLAVI